MEPKLSYAKVHVFFEEIPELMLYKSIDPNDANKLLLHYL